MDRLLLSFVVPVYNVERYLNECLDSIFDESANDDEFEVIAVNDGSTDSSAEILKTYAHRKNLRIITQVNGGLSTARNAGIKASSGKYIAFVDSDDFLLPGAVPALLGFARQSNNDIIEFDYETTNETSLRLKKFRTENNRIPISGRGSAVFPRWRAQHTFISMVWIRIYKRKLLIDNNLLFFPGIIHEDEEWIYRCFFYATNVMFHPLAIYNYRRREGSISLRDNSGMYRRCLDTLTIIDSLANFVDTIADNPENVEYLDAMDKVISDLYRSNFKFLSNGNAGCTAEKEKVTAELMKRKHLLKTTGGSKSRYLCWFLRIFSLRTAIKLDNFMDRF